MGDIREIAADDAFLFLWSPMRYIRDAFDILDAWGFTYRFMMTWHKPGGMQMVGMPQFNAEHVLVGVRGKPKFTDTKAFPIAFYAKRGRHSEKPDAFYDLLRRVAPKPAIDIFNRRHIIGFDAAGDEAEQAPQRMLL